jgi:hypothetical protein
MRGVSFTAERTCNISRLARQHALVCDYTTVTIAVLESLRARS